MLAGGGSWLMLMRGAHRCAVLADGGNISTTFVIVLTDDSRALYVSTTLRKLQRRGSSSDAHSRTRVRLQQAPNTIEAACIGSVCQRGASMDSLKRVELGSVPQQQLDGGRVPTAASTHQGCDTIPVLQVDRCPVTQQCLHDW